MDLITLQLTKRDHTYSNRIRLELLREQRRRLEKYLWKGRIPVSAITSWDICPKKLVKDQSKSKWFKSKTLEKMLLGKAIHTMFQMASVNTPNLKWIKPYNIPAHLKERLEDVWPEVPLQYIDPDSGEVIISGIADDVENYAGKPAILEIKSVNSDPVRFKNYFEKDYPLEKHVMQAKIYQILANWNGYYSPFKVEWAKLLYFNTRMEHGEGDNIVELYYSASDEEETKLDLICQEATRHILSKDKNLDCRYRYCHEHI